MLRRIACFVYGSIAYAIFLVTFLYAIGFIGNFAVPTTLDGPARGSLGMGILVNVLLLGLFATQHSVMARKGFKDWWTRIIPKPIERSTYVLASSLCLLLLFWQWRPLGGTIWDVQNPAGRAALYGLFGFGFALVLVATFLINHFDLFGMRQVWMYLRGQEYRPLRFATPWAYRMIRHPLYLGWFFAFWATPTMTAAHLLFSVMTTAYILTAIPFEERDLVQEHGPAYAEYRLRVPMFIPWKRSPQPVEKRTSPTDVA